MSAPAGAVPTQDLDAYRVRITRDELYDFDECDGGAMPMDAERYAGNEYYKDGAIVPHDEYLRYYGNPDRHVVLAVSLERRCTCCDAWSATGESLHGIDFMDDAPEVTHARAGRYYVGTRGDVRSVREILAVDDYLAEVTRDLLSEAGVDVPAPAKPPEPPARPTCADCGVVLQPDTDGGAIVCEACDERRERAGVGGPWVIRNPEGLYWSNAIGWITRDAADAFTDAEHATLALPMGGTWIREVSE